MYNPPLHQVHYKTTSSRKNAIAARELLKQAREEIEKKDKATAKRKAKLSLETACEELGFNFYGDDLMILLEFSHFLECAGIVFDNVIFNDLGQKQLIPAFSRVEY